MTKPTAFLSRMLAFLAIVGVVVALLYPSLHHAFEANPILNGFILFVLALGVIWNIRQVLLLRPEVDWLEAFRNPRQGDPARPTPRLLGPMASMLAARRTDRFTLSTAAMRSLLDGISSRLDETRELSRYMTGLLIFLGLLGTFWGLLLTIGAVAEVIGGMSVGSGDVNALFNQLKAGLAEPLRGMGVAFSSSMLGLAGALVLGFLDLTAGQAQNRFYTELEDWLASQTRLSSGALGSESEGGSMPVFVHALLEQTAENLEQLQAIMARGEEARGTTATAVAQLAEQLSLLGDQMRGTQQMIARMAEQQAQLTPVLTQLAAHQGQSAIDDAARGHLRNTELLLARLLEEVASGRAQSTQELRSEIRVLTRTIMAISGGAQQIPGGNPGG
ncbi:flagellar motor protein MotA [Roseococcus sp. SYP-B2431]|uniref:flagellar motor protein MotA n=1 Tax=Roseococcus sp. SYP-B2431 TaxID=2496640 RepID=UPI00103900B8|nr:flagellar motor protein MotA [Roseococcus sp. SYP-B2431]TCI00447.1 flagellar motor protein MotA [Roseococcus sp. SYP-B2431]